MTREVNYQLLQKTYSLLGKVVQRLVELESERKELLEEREQEHAAELKAERAISKSYMKIIKGKK